MMGQHTPAPWVWNTIQPTHPLDRITMMLNDENDNGILFHSAWWEIPEADARLIKAAPHLLAACLSVMEDTDSVKTEMLLTKAITIATGVAPEIE
jgi:hypothetical protein